MLKQQLEKEISVFLNLSEFAEEHSVNGKIIKCILDDNYSEASTASSSGIINPTGIGILTAERKIFCDVKDFQERFIVGDRIEIDHEHWIIEKISYNNQMLEMDLNRNY